MGMLMHHTWLAQQEEQKKRKKTAKPADPVAEEQDEYEIPVKTTVNRRKPSRK